MYYRVPINNGVLDIDYSTLLHAITLSDTEAYVLVNTDDKRDSWTDITEEQFNAVKPPEPTQQPAVNEIDDLRTQLSNTNADFQNLMDYLASTGVIA